MPLQNAANLHPPVYLSATARRRGDRVKRRAFIALVGGMAIAACRLSMKMPLSTDDSNFARHESGVGHTTRNLGAKIRHRRSGGDGIGRGEWPKSAVCKPTLPLSSSRHMSRRP